MEGSQNSQVKKKHSILKKNIKILHNNSIQDENANNFDDDLVGSPDSGPKELALKPTKFYIEKIGLSA